MVSSYRGICGRHALYDGTAACVLVAQVCIESIDFHRRLSAIQSGGIVLSHRFSPHFHDVEERLAERAVTISYGAVRVWWLRPARFHKLGALVS